MNQPYKGLGNWLTLMYFSVSSGVFAAPLVEAMTTSPAAVRDRLLIAAAAGGVVQALMLVTSQRGFKRLDRSRYKWRAHLTNACEVLSTGIAAACMIGFLRGVVGLQIPVEGEFAIAAVAGSKGAEVVFGRLDAKSVGIIEGEQEGKS
jgi:hypothetical protein